MGLFDHLYNLDWTARYPLEYYYNNGRHVTFKKYEIDMFGNIYNKKTGVRLSYSKIGDYDKVTVTDSTMKKCNILIARAVVSTFHGKPPTKEHSTEHVDCTNKNNDIVCELTWMDSLGQNKNRNQPEELLTAFIIVREDLEMTNKEWLRHLSDEKNHMGREYTKKMMRYYAQKKQHGFYYKVYDDLPGEKWYEVRKSENKMGRWEISDQNRIAYVTKHARNVIDATRFGFMGKYPTIGINGKNRLLHAVAFEAYYPEEYAAMKPGEMILHEFDDKLDFRPHKLRIGNASENRKDAHYNGCYDDTKIARTPCCSYVDEVFEKRHESQDAAATYLKENGYPRASQGNISTALGSTTVSTMYGRMWKNIDTT
jgi:hypothetical protein